MREGRNRTIDYCRKNSESCEQTGIGAIPHEWALRPLTEFAQQERNAFSNGPFGSDLLSNELQTQGVPVIYIRDISRYVFNWRSRVYVSDQKATQLSAFSVRFGDVLITKVGSPPCEAAVYNKDVPSVITQDVIRLRPSKGVDSYFLMLMINSLYAQREVRKIKIEGTRERVSLTDFKKIKLPFPPLPEQQKIAAILSTWDEAIEKTQSLIDQLRQRNEGLAQQLLTGKKRLKGFSDAWTTVHIYQIAEPLNMINKEGLALDVLSCTKYSGLVKSLDYFGKRVYGADLRKYKIVPKGTFAYATNHIEEGSIGYQKFSEDCLISPMYTVFRTNGTVNDGFLLRLLKSDKMIYAYQSNMSGSINRRGGLRWKDFSSILTSIPSIKEQMAIHAVLSQSDHELKMHEQHLMVLRQQKKGLMQNLLTGKIRVKPNS